MGEDSRRESVDLSQKLFLEVEGMGVVFGQKHRPLL
jgi:hypothetical protein